MGDIAFTLKSYENIGARSARRGNDISLREPSVRSAVDALVEARKDHGEIVKSIRQRGAELLDQELLEENRRYNELRNTLRERRNTAVRLGHERALARLNEELRDNNFSWKLSIGPKVGNRQTYELCNEFYHRIAAKQVEASLIVGTRRYQPSRHSIVAALKQALEKPFSYGVVRLDIRNFFDSVPHDKLLLSVNSNSRIDSVTKKLVNKLLAEYSEITGQSNGMPQGVGISSKLADVFLRDIDDALVTDPRVSFYARFVDDIIVVTKNPEHVEELKQYSVDLLNKIGLEVNGDKTTTFKTGECGEFPKSTRKFEYLGYQFLKPRNTALKVYLSDARVSKIEAKLQRAFKVWENASRSLGARDKSGIDGLLSDRVRFLTTNTSLHNSKEKVSVGVFFSNREINEHSQLRELDNALKNLIANYEAKMSENLVKRLQKYSFLLGFKEKQFSRFSLQAFRRISACWGDLK